MIDLILAVLQTQKYITISDLNPQWSKLCFDNYTLELKSYILDQSLVLKEGFYFSLHTYFEAESTKAPQSARRERVNELHHR